MKTAIAILVLGLSVGCASKQDQKPWNEPAAWRPGTPIAKESVYPDDNESALTAAQKEKLEQLRRDWRPVEVSTPFDADPAMRALFLDWYGKGYTFFEATGMQVLPPYNQPDSQQQRVKAAGWGAGELAARLKRLNQLFENLKNGQPGGTPNGGPAPPPGNSGVAEGPPSVT
jgi:hypothetical protein